MRSNLDLFIPHGSSANEVGIRQEA
jgi:hypothetical protein